MEWDGFSSEGNSLWGPIPRLWGKIKLAREDDVTVSLDQEAITKHWEEELFEKADHSSGVNDIVIDTDRDLLDMTSDIGRPTCLKKSSQQTNFSFH